MSRLWYYRQYVLWVKSKVMLVMCVNVLFRECSNRARYANTYYITFRVIMFFLPFYLLQICRFIWLDIFPYCFSFSRSMYVNCMELLNHRTNNIKQWIIWVDSSCRFTNPYGIKMSVLLKLRGGVLFYDGWRKHIEDVCTRILDHWWIM